MEQLVRQVAIKSQHKQQSFHNAVLPQSRPDSSNPQWAEPRRALEQDTGQRDTTFTETEQTGHRNAAPVHNRVTAPGTYVTPCTDLQEVLIVQSKYLEHL